MRQLRIRGGREGPGCWGGARGREEHPGRHTSAQAGGCPGGEWPGGRSPGPPGLAESVRFGWTRTTGAEMTPRTLDGKATAQATGEDLTRRVAELARRGITPGLGPVLVGDDPGSRS